MTGEVSAFKVSILIGQNVTGIPASTPLLRLR